MAYPVPLLMKMTRKEPGNFFVFYFSYFSLSYLFFLSFMLHSLRRSVGIIKLLTHLAINYVIVVLLVCRSEHPSLIRLPTSSPRPNVIYSFFCVHFTLLSLFQQLLQVMPRVKDVTKAAHISKPGICYGCCRTLSAQNPLL